MSERRGDLLSSEMHWLVRHARPLRFLLIADLLCMIFGSALSLLDPLVVKWLIDVALPSHTLRPVLLGTLIFCLIYVASLGVNYLASFLSCLVTQKMVFRIRMSVLRRLHVLPAPCSRDSPGRRHLVPHRAGCGSRGGTEW